MIFITQIFVLKNIIKSNLIFLVPLILTLSVSMFFLLNYTKADIHIWFNQFHSKGFDTFFIIFTNAGDGLTAVGIIIILLFIKFRYALGALFSLLSAAGFSQLIKRQFFGDLPRPKMFFSSHEFYQKNYTLYIAQGYDAGIWYPFPSGHSTTAFAIFGFCALISKNKGIKAFFFILALLSAYSRVYLSNHFLMDITAGAILGTILCFFSFYFVQKIKWNWIEKSLFKKNNKG